LTESASSDRFSVIPADLGQIDKAAAETHTNDSYSGAPQALRRIHEEIGKSALNFANYPTAISPLSNARYFS
jgi:hypothetical protein